MVGGRAGSVDGDSQVNRCIAGFAGFSDVTYAALVKRSVPGMLTEVELNWTDNPAAITLKTVNGGGARRETAKVISIRGCRQQRAYVISPANT